MEDVGRIKGHECCFHPRLLVILLMGRKDAPSAQTCCKCGVQRVVDHAGEEVASPTLEIEEVAG